MLRTIRAGLTAARPVTAWRWASLLWVTSTALLLLINQYRNGPAVLADELGYIGVARFLAGAAPLPNMFTASFYHFGYSLFIVPAFWLGTDPVSAYRWIMVINCLLVAAIAPLSYIFARKVLRAEHGAALLMALLALIYPANAVQTNSAWSENVLTPLFLLWVLGVFAVSANPKPARLIGLSLLAPLLYLVHPRMLGVEALTLVYLVFATMVMDGRRTRFALASVILVVAHLLVTRALRDMRHIAYETPFGSIHGFLHLLTQFPAGRLPAAASGEAMYLSCGSDALILVGLVGLCWTSVRDFRAHSTTGMSLTALVRTPMFWAILGVLSIFAASTITMSSGTRLDHWLYGRYVEPTTPILLMAGFAVIQKQTLIRRIAPWLVVVLLLACPIWLYGKNVTTPFIAYGNIPTIAPLLFVLHQLGSGVSLDFAVVVLLTLAPIIFIAACGKRAALPIVCLYICSSVLTIYFWHRHLVGSSAYPVAIKQAHHELWQGHLLQDKIFVDRSAFADADLIPLFYRMQFFLDKNHFIVVMPADFHHKCLPSAPTESTFTEERTIIHLTAKSALWVNKDTGTASTVCIGKLSQMVNSVRLPQAGTHSSA